jgi:hypothetical protein
MNEHKMKRLMDQARAEQCPAAPADFIEDTLRMVRAQVVAPTPTLPSMNHQLNSLFSRVSLACLSIIILAVMVDWGFTAAGFPQPDDGASQVTAQSWFSTDEM